MFNSLKQREGYGMKHNSKYPFYNFNVNLDSVLSRLSCSNKDVFRMMGEVSEVPPFACKFRKDDKRSNLLAVATEDGDLLLFNINQKNALIKSLRAHNNAIFDICWLPDKPLFITGSADCNAALWDMAKLIPITCFDNHTGSVKAVDVCSSQSSIFASGARDGVINVWDIRIGKSYNKTPEIHIENAHYYADPFNTPSPVVKKKNRLRQNHRAHTCRKNSYGVTSVAFQDSHTLASAGVIDGIVKIWDLRKTYKNISCKRLPMPRHEMLYSKDKSFGHGCTNLTFDSTYKKLYASSTKNGIYQFDCHNYKKNYVAVFTGFKCSTYFIKSAISADDQYLISGSSDNKAYIWKTSSPGDPILALPGHTAEVTSVTWNPQDITKVVTCGDDDKVLVWRVEHENDEEPFAMCTPVQSPGHAESDKDLNDHLNKSLCLSDSDSPRNTNVSDCPPKRPSPGVKSVITRFFSPVSGIKNIQPSNEKSENKSNIDTKESSKLSEEGENKSNINNKKSPTSNEESENKCHMNSKESLSNSNEKVENKSNMNSEESTPSSVILNQDSENNDEDLIHKSINTPSVQSQVLSPSKRLNHANTSHSAKKRLFSNSFEADEISPISKKGKENKKGVSSDCDMITSAKEQPKHLSSSLSSNSKSKPKKPTKAKSNNKMDKKVNSFQSRTLMNYFCIDLSPTK